MLEESAFECSIRWHLYRRWKRPPRRLRLGEYNFHQMMKRVRKDGLFIDLGANVGDVTRQALRYGMKVIAFEPDPVAREVLSNRFRGDDRVRIIPKAVGAGARIATFHQPQLDEVWRTEASSLYCSDGHQGGTSFEVEVIDLVDFLQTIDEPIAVLKMDIEGAEVECIESILDSGIHTSIGQILVETHEAIFPDLADRTRALRERIEHDGYRNIDLSWV
ncbi:Nodulation protein NoeI [Mesorhizobium plurifarium]|uniref:Nodulation protein NoeI n=1 Tax=Mesorhizobium plurifarium TaxID=69974 RepID=A0A090G3N1_MESPL|nr:Nodulation protein NoeI [Mesorhizobium plurifarium]